MMVDIIQNVLLGVMAGGLISQRRLGKARTDLIYGITAVLLGITIPFDPPMAMWDKLFQIWLYCSGVYNIYKWWHNDDDFRNKRKKLWSKAKIKFRTFVVFKPRALAGAR